jgi:hypothetical protein
MRPIYKIKSKNSDNSDTSLSTATGGDNVNTNTSTNNLNKQKDKSHQKVINEMNALSKVNKNVKDQENGDDNFDSGNSSPNQIPFINKKTKKSSNSILTSDDSTLLLSTPISNQKEMATTSPGGVDTTSLFVPSTLFQSTNNQPTVLPFDTKVVNSKFKNSQIDENNNNRRKDNITTIYINGNLDNKEINNKNEIRYIPLMRVNKKKQNSGKYSF